VEITSWVDDWQMQCCGHPFAIGSAVSWTIRDADHDWLVAVLGPSAAATVDAAEEHHGGDTERTVDGMVMSIAAVHCRYEPAANGDPKVLHAVAWTGTLTQLDAADGWTPGHNDLKFVGYLVRLAVTAV
jgi:isopentenyldiphosphate isomerase